MDDPVAAGDQQFEDGVERAHGGVHLHDFVVEEIRALAVVGPSEGAVVPAEDSGAIGIVEGGVALDGELPGEQVQPTEGGVWQAAAGAENGCPGYALAGPVARPERVPVVDAAGDVFLMGWVKRIDAAKRIDPGEVA